MGVSLESITKFNRNKPIHVAYKYSSRDIIEYLLNIVKIRSVSNHKYINYIQHNTKLSDNSKKELKKLIHLKHEQWSIITTEINPLLHTSEDLLKIILTKASTNTDQKKSDNSWLSIIKCWIYNIFNKN